MTLISASPAGTSPIMRVLLSSDPSTSTLAFPTRKHANQNTMVTATDAVALRHNTPATAETA